MASVHTLSVLLFALALLTGCARNEVRLALAAPDTSVADIATINVATSRAFVGKGTTVYSGDRSSDVNFAEIQVSIPKNREPGTVVYPRTDPFVDRQFAAVGYTANKSAEAFVADINRQLAARPAADRSIFLFVHGYNTNFAAGVYRQAQMFKDFGFNGVAVNFSWASAGKTPLYLYDRDSAHLARNALRRTIKLLGQTKARGIVLVGHSMGGFVTMETLRDMGIRGEKQALQRIETLILASPDIDRTVFLDQLAEVDPRPSPFVIFVSRKDRALQASQTLSGGQARVGEGQEIDVLREQGITVIDLTNLTDGQDAANHTTFATSKTLFAMAKNGQFSRETLLGKSKAPDPIAQGIGRTVGSVTDLAAAIVYLPAKIAGVR